MYIKRFYLPCLAHASYLIADEATRTAVVVDPQRDVEQYLQGAAENNFEIRQCFLTHFHADFASGHLELQGKTGCTIHLGAKAKADYEFAPMADGATNQFGAMQLSVMETPGHTLESISLVLHDLDVDKVNATAVFTGDTLFIGDVGRPDLSGNDDVSAEAMARQLYHSLHSKILKLPDQTIVYPAHGAGSVCGKRLSDQPQSTLREQRLSNYALKAANVEEFVQLLNADQCPPPKYFAYDSHFNRTKHANLDQILSKSVVPLVLEEVLDLQNRGCELLDVRIPDEFASGHIAGSINVPLNGRFAHWVGSLIDYKSPLVIVANAGKEQEAALMLGRIGYDQIKGYLKDEISTLKGHEFPKRTVERISAEQLRAFLKEAREMLILDVREEQEANLSRIDGSLNVPLQSLPSALARLRRDVPIFVHCASGQRSSIASSLLLKHEISGFKELLGGMQAFQRAS